jgi:hypothetical protein
MYDVYTFLYTHRKSDIRTTDINDAKVYNMHAFCTLIKSFQQKLQILLRLTFMMCMLFLYTHKKVSYKSYWSEWDLNL